MFNHFKFSSVSGKWDTLELGADYDPGGSPDQGVVAIGKNFSVCSFRNNTIMTAYKNSGTQLETVDSLSYSYVSGENPSIVVGDDYYAFSAVNWNGQNETAVIRTWNGQGFGSTDFGSLSTDHGGHFTFVSLGNRLIISWTTYTSGDVRKVGYTTYSPGSGGWSSPVTLMDSTSFQIDCTSYGMSITGNAFAEMSYTLPSGVTPPPVAVKVYEFQGASFYGMTVGSFPVRYSSEHLYEQPQYWLLQPGGNFIALSRPGMASGGVNNDPYSPDSINIFTFTHTSDGYLQFAGTPTVPVVYQKIVTDGMGDSSKYTYSFDSTSGVFNQYLTPEYENVTETLPGSNGKISTSYYVEKDSSANGINYKFLEGMPYKTADYSSTNDLVKETDNTWTDVAVDSTNGVFDIQLLEDSTTTDDVLNVISYQYEDVIHKFMLSKKTETNSDGTQRITRMMYPSDYRVQPAADTMTKALYAMQVSNDINPVIDKWVIQKSSSGTQTVVSSDLVEYFQPRSDQILPYEHLILRSASPIPLSSFDSSVSAGDFACDTNYVVDKTFNNYDTCGNLLQSTDGEGYVTSYAYGYHGSRLIGAAKNSGGGPILFDDFNDGSITDGDPFTWSTINPSDWSVSNGTLISNAGGYAGNMSATFQNFTADVRLKITNYGSSTENWSAIYFGSTGTDPSSGGYMVYLRYNGNVELYNHASGVLAKDSSGVLSSSWRRLTVSVNGTNVQVFLDGQLVINYTLSSAPAAGYVALYSYYNTSDFDDFRCYPYGGTAYSYGYDPTTLQLTNENGPNNNPTCYTYDSFQRPLTVQNYQHSLVRSYFYQPYPYFMPRYVTTFSYRSSGDSTVTSVDYDGLGRMIQSQTADGGTNAIISDKTYDQVGRDSLTYKPFEHSTNGLDYISDSQVNSYDISYYNNNVYDGIPADSYPYSTNKYYPDPLGRLQETIPPGNPWQSKPVTYSYGTNAPGEVSGYSANTLYKTTITDEDGKEKLDYKDKFGNLVETVTDPGGLNLTDSMKYDVMGNLTESYSPIGYATTYSYNTLGQLTQKTSPDAGTTQYLYDENGNLRLVKDADRTGTTNNTYPFSGSLYGTSSHNESLPMTMPGNVDIELDNYYGSYEDDTLFVAIESSNGTPIESAYCTLDEGYNDLYIPYLPKGTYVCAFRSTADPNDQGAEFDYDAMCNSNDEFTYKKYDAMNRLTEEDLYYGNSAGGDFTQANANNVSFPSGVNGGDYGIEIFRRNYFYDTPSPDPNATGQRNINGRLSYTESYDVNGNLVERTSYSYEDMGRVEWMVQSGGFTAASKRITYTYDLQGNVTYKDYSDYGNSFYNSYIWNNSYDAAGRLSSAGGQMDYSVLQATCEYYASGKPSQTTFGSSPIAATINYHYNERDWLISDSTTNFWEHIGYNNIAEVGTLFGVTQQYNGNISWDSYYMSGLTYTDPSTHQSTNTVGYAFGYDNANRLTGAGFGYSPSLNNWAWSGPYNMSTSYYDDGNVRNLQRNGSTSSQIDNLNYYYRPGTDIDTLITNSAGNGSTYTCDNNGDMTSDSRNNIGFEIYNIYNEPEALYMNNGSVVQYGYDVSGNRVSKVVSGIGYAYIRGKDGNTDVVHTEPDGDLTVNLYANGEKIAQCESDNGYYYLKDHLGDIKMIVDQNGTPQAWNDYYPFGETMPGRSQFNAGPDTRYQYISVENDAETGLYHTGPRTYDPWRLGFGQTDPAGDLSLAESPYIYSHDNAVTFSDPGGAYSYEINGMPVSDEVGQALMDQTNIQQYELNQQAQQYQNWENMLNSAGDFAKTTPPMMPLATPDMASATSLTMGTVGDNLPVLQYQQSSGAIWEVYPNGDVELIGVGYSGGYMGHTEALNNPNMEYAFGIGPLPRGMYFIGQLGTHGAVGRNSMHLTPSYTTAADILSYGRTPNSFFIHANNPSKPPCWSSEGCIVTDYTTRLNISNGIAKVLEVVQ